MASTQLLETPEARKARHFDTLRRLGTLAMDLAQDAHALAKQQLAPRPRPAGLPANVAGTVDYARTFAVLSRAVRQAIALEIRRETEPRTRPSFRPLGAPIDPRRSLLRTVFHAAIAADPDRARLRPQVDQHIDHQLEADPDGCRPIVEIVDELVNSLGIDLDPARLPDALLGIPPRNRFAESSTRPGEPRPPPTR
ncbi:MAG: hypothetical protein ACRYG8_28455 [Janthinobacterium lividum]